MDVYLGVIRVHARVKKTGSSPNPVCPESIRIGYCSPSWLAVISDAIKLRAQKRALRTLGRAPPTSVQVLLRVLIFFEHTSIALLWW